MKIINKVFSIKTPKEGFIDITRVVQSFVSENNISKGQITVFSLHTTAGITVNENADSDVVSDMLYALDLAFPDRVEYRHFEGNTNAHLKTSYTGVSETFIIENGQLMLGIWQGIYFCEFDGPRFRKYALSIIGE